MSSTYFVDSVYVTNTTGMTRLKLLKIYRRFGKIFCLHHEDTRINIIIP